MRFQSLFSQIVLCNETIHVDLHHIKPVSILVFVDCVMQLIVPSRLPPGIQSFNPCFRRLCYATLPVSLRPYIWFQFQSLFSQIVLCNPTETEKLMALLKSFNPCFRRLCYATIKCLCIKHIYPKSFNPCFRRLCYATLVKNMMF